MEEKHTHHCVRAIYNGKIRLRWWLAEYEQSSTENVVLGIASAHPGLQDRIMLTCTRIENAHKERMKTFNFLLCIEVQQTFCFPFSLLRHYQMPEWFYFKNCCFWARATVLYWYRNMLCCQCGQRFCWSAIADKIKTIVWDKVNLCGTQS